jgi:hypothetical protein
VIHFCFNVLFSICVFLFVTVVVDIDTRVMYFWMIKYKISKMNIGHEYSIWSSHSSGYKGFYLLGYNAMYSTETQPTFRRNMSPQSSGSKNKPRKTSEWKQAASRGGILVGVSLDPEHGGDMFLRNVGWLWTDYTTLCLKRYNSS